VGRGNGGGEWGVEWGQNATPFSGEDWSLGRWQRAGGGGSGTQSGFRRKKTVGLADRAGLPVSEGAAAGQAGPEGKGERWAVAGPKSLLRLKSKEVKENQFCN
jgi:hypothetical protein